MTEDYIALALNALRQKDFAAARSAINSFAVDHEMEFQHYMIKGLSELALLEWEAAENTFSEASILFPHQPQIWQNLGVAQENLGDIDEAAESLEHSLALKPEQADACGNLSNVYRKLGRFTEAEKMAHRAYELGAPHAQALNSLGLALNKQGKYDAAEKTFSEALRLEANNPQINANLANCYVDQLKFDSAWPLFAKARSLSDDAIIRRDEGMARLLTGDYQKGFELYEARLSVPGALRFKPNCPLYSGGSFDGKKILLIAEQGYGDTLMFCRYGTYLQEAGAQLTWVVQKPLQWVLQGNVPGTIMVEGDELPPADFYIPLLSLPRVTNKMPPDVSGSPYIVTSATTELPKEKPGLRKIGLVWSGSPTHERDHERSIPLQEFQPLLRMSTMQFYAPFIGAGIEEIKNDTPVLSLAGQIEDFADTASLLKQFECIVTVDTAIAHLAGAMGVKTFLLLPYCPDWRWGTHNIITPWYKNMTLLRQPRYGEWNSVIQELITRLG
ncbi:MAG: tetratricopeptide repeat-containing glycosyltransferase family protein [Alphaproteobacteria bacterium]